MERRNKIKDMAKQAKEGRLTDLPIEPVKKLKEAKDKVVNRY